MAVVHKIEPKVPALICRKRVAAYARVSMETEAVVRQIYVEKSIVQKSVGHAWNMIVHSIVTDRFLITVALHGKLHLPMMPVVKRTRRNVNTTSTIRVRNFAYDRCDTNGGRTTIASFTEYEVKEGFDSNDFYFNSILPNECET